MSFRFLNLLTFFVAFLSACEVFAARAYTPPESPPTPSIDPTPPVPPLSLENVNSSSETDSLRPPLDPSSLGTLAAMGVGGGILALGSTSVLGTVGTVGGGVAIRKHGDYRDEKAADALANDPQDPLAKKYELALHKDDLFEEPHKNALDLYKISLQSRVDPSQKQKRTLNQEGFSIFQKEEDQEKFQKSAAQDLEDIREKAIQFHKNVGASFKASSDQLEKKQGKLQSKNPHKKVKWHSVRDKARNVLKMGRKEEVYRHDVTSLALKKKRGKYPVEIVERETEKKIRRYRTCRQLII
jgi:hypothetical protein